MLVLETHTYRETVFGKAHLRTVFVNLVTNLIATAIIRSAPLLTKILFQLNITDQLNNGLRDEAHFSL